MDKGLVVESVQSSFTLVTYKVSHPKSFGDILRFWTRQMG